MLFDGECALCNGFVDFCLRRSPHLSVAPLDSELGRRQLARHGLPLDLQSFVYVEKQLESGACIAHTRSDAALHALSALPHWGWLLVMLAAPAPR